MTHLLADAGRHGVDRGLLPTDRANMLSGWIHSGFNVHRSNRVQPFQHEGQERLAQYIIRNSFSDRVNAARHRSAERRRTWLRVC